MRKDMERVIITPGRVGGGYSKGRNYREANKDIETLPKREAMRKSRDKSFSDLLGPLINFLQSEVGRPWDKVYSEICEHADSRSLTGWHLREHVSFAMYLANEILISDGRIYLKPRYWGGHRELDSGDLYVDPSSGLLKEYKKRPTKEDRRLESLSLEERLVRIVGSIETNYSSTKKVRALEFINGKLYKTCVTNDREHQKATRLATAADAHEDFNDKGYYFFSSFFGLKGLIFKDLKKLKSSDSEYIRALAEIATKNKKKIEKENKDEEFLNTLVSKKKARKNAKRRSQHESG